MMETIEMSGMDGRGEMGERIGREMGGVEMGGMEMGRRRVEIGGGWER